VWEVCCARLLGCIFPFGSPTASPWRSSGFAHSPHDEVALSRRRCTHLIDHYYCNKRFNIAKGVLEEDLRRPSHYHNATTTLCLSLPLRVRPRGQNPRYCAVVSPSVSQSLSVSLSGTDYESEGRRFESCRAHYKLPANAVFSPSGIDPGVVPYHTIDHLSSQRLRWAISSAVFRWGKGLPRPTI
jgi:hypothetical protein